MIGKISNSTRKQVIKWMISLPSGENDSKIQKAIENAKLTDMSDDQICELINTGFGNQLDDFIAWNHELNSLTFK